MTGILMRAESQSGFGGDFAMATLGEIAEVNAASRDAVEERRKQERERRRLKKQRQREKRAADADRAALAEAERMEREAARREILDEELAPAILRREIVATIAGVSVMIVGPRVRIVDGKPVRALADQIADDPLAPHGASTIQLSDRQRRAVRTLRLDWSDVGTGVNSGAVDYLRDSGGGAERYPDEDTAMLAQIEARARLEGAMTYLGAFAPGIARVVLDCIPVSVFRIEITGVPGMEKAAEDPLAWLRAGLNRLADFYWPPKEPGEENLKLLTFGPSRGSYEVDPPDIERKKILHDEPYGT